MARSTPRPKATGPIPAAVRDLTKNISVLGPGSVHDSDAFALRRDLELDSHAAP